jgi:hypothetical protein
MRAYRMFVVVGLSLGACSLLLPGAFTPKQSFASPRGSPDGGADMSWVEVLLWDQDACLTDVITAEHTLVFTVAPGEEVQVAHTYSASDGAVTGFYRKSSLPGSGTWSVKTGTVSFASLLPDGIASNFGGEQRLLDARGHYDLTFALEDGGGDSFEVSGDFATTCHGTPEAAPDAGPACVQGGQSGGSCGEGCHCCGNACVCAPGSDACPDAG